MSEDVKDSDQKSGEAKSEHKPPAGAQTAASWEGPDGERIDYLARAGWMVLRKDEQPAAEMFSVSYVADHLTGAAERPVSFIFNGGPGSASAYLHLGAAGPQRVAFPPDGSLPRMPPKLVPNAESWLGVSDLVFVDPIGTGFSRVIPTDGKKDAAKDEDAATEYFGYKKDLESLVEFMSRWLSANGRWGSPVFIAGESYGGYRVGRLVKMAQESGGIGLNGAILISPAMELAGLSSNDYDVLAWVDLLPSYALAAVHHGRSRAFPDGAPVEEVIAQAESFATGDYATLLTRGASLPVLDRQRIFARFADLIGLSVDFVIRAEGRVPIEVFVRELLRDQRLSVGLYDATITSVDPFPDRAEFIGPDPTLSGITSVYTAAINRVLRSDIGVETDREYVLLSYDVNRKWKNDAPEHFFAPPISATDDFRYGMALNPHMRAFITHGRYDLVTPFYTTDRLYNLMRLDPATAERLTVQHFGGGHMFYAWEQSRRDFTAAIKAFFADAV